MNNWSADSFEVEEARIRAVYEKSRGTKPQGDAHYSLFSPGHLFMIQELERRMLKLLKRNGFASLGAKHILEIGCGGGYWLRELIQWGARPQNVTGIDLFSERVAEARRLCPEGARFECGNAAKIGFPDAAFDLVLQSTIFSSVLNPNLRQLIASEMLRVVKADGIILWYDFYMNNPWNPDVQGMKKREIFRLFPGCKIELRRISLAPPLCRFLVPYSWLTSYILERLKIFNTHYLGVITKL